MTTQTDLHHLLVQERTEGLEATAPEIYIDESRFPAARGARATKMA